MLYAGTAVNQYLSIYPTTMAEKDLYVATSIIPNIAVSLTDDFTDETSNSSF